MNSSSVVDQVSQRAAERREHVDAARWRGVDPRY
jgi:hypothetical protein